jgi:hypothetical protein
VNQQMIQLDYEVELAPGEKLSLPASIVDKVGPGRWLVTVRPSSNEAQSSVVRRHDGFLRGYAPEDEGLYDDLAG